MNEIDIRKGEAESLEEYVWRLGSAKADPMNTFNPKWEELAEVINGQTGSAYEESYWRKMFKSMQKSMIAANAQGSLDMNLSPETRSALRTFELQQVKLRDERTAYRSEIRRDARTQDLMEKLCEAVARIPPFERPETRRNPEDYDKSAVYAMLSDIHYGIQFSNAVGVYSSEIAQQRVFEYAEKIKQIQAKTNAAFCYVSLMGDLVSGQIHQSIRVENRENIVNQIIGVSELVAEFLYMLSDVFETVYVNAVDGNHSRMEANIKNDIRSERLDRLIPWFCKARLYNIPNIEFIDAQPDSSIGVFNIYNKTYVAVHGDFDLNKDTVHNIQDLIGKPVDYFLSAHLHVPTMRLERTGFIQNGAVISSGDDYTVRNRLFGKPYQVCMLVNEEGVEAVYPVKL